MPPARPSPVSSFPTACPSHVPPPSPVDPVDPVRGPSLRMVRRNASTDEAMYSCSILVRARPAGSGAEQRYAVGAQEWREHHKQERTCVRAGEPRAAAVKKRSVSLCPCPRSVPVRGCAPKRWERTPSTSSRADIGRPSTYPSVTSWTPLWTHGHERVHARAHRARVRGQ